jgi:uncharacterized protein YciI
MTNLILNNQPLNVFIIIAETLEKWQSPQTEEGKKVLLEHYAWGAELKANNKLLLAGPTDFERIASKEINPIGHTTGIIILRAENRADAEMWAEKDPFHLHGYRKNVVHSFRISMTEENVYHTFEKLIQPQTT